MPDTYSRSSAAAFAATDVLPTTPAPDDAEVSQSEVRLPTAGHLYGKELGRVRVMPTPRQSLFRRIAGGIAAIIATAILWRGYGMVRNAMLISDIRNGDTSSVSAYLAGGGLGNIQDFGGKSALFEAATRGDAGIVDELLRHGAAPTWDDLNETAVRGHGDVLYSLLESYGSANLSAVQKGQLLCSAAQSGDVDSVRLLLHRGALTTYRDTRDEGLTPLMFAARSGKTGVIYALLDAGADLNARSSSKGATVLMIAAAWNVPATCQYLIKNGARVDATDQAGNTALMSAAATGNAPTADLLIGYGASVNARNHAGKSASDLASDNGDEHMLNLLRHYGAH
jgi:ankyrin repeat protein